MFPLFFQNRNELHQICDTVIAPGVFDLFTVVARVDAGISAALHIGSQAVAQHDALAFVHRADGVKDHIEKCLLRFLAAHLFGDKNSVKVLIQSRLGKSDLLGQSHTVGHGIELVLALDRIEELHAIGFIVDLGLESFHIKVVGKEGIGLDAKECHKSGETLPENITLWNLAALILLPQHIVDGKILPQPLVGIFHTVVIHDIFHTGRGTFVKIKQRVVHIRQNNFVRHRGLLSEMYF